MPLNMPKPITLAAAIVAIAYATAAVAQGDPAAGHKKALQCQACHGLDGMAKLPDAPNLAGQNPVYLVKALQDFRSGARKNDMMSLVAGKLSDADIEDLAAYYASIKITAALPK